MNCFKRSVTECVGRSNQRLFFRALPLPYCYWHAPETANAQSILTETRVRASRAMGVSLAPLGVPLLWASRAFGRLGLRSQHCSYHYLTRAGISSNHGVAVCTCQEHLAYSVTLQPVWVALAMYQDCTFRQRVCTPSHSPRVLFYTASPTQYLHSTSHFVCIDPSPRLLHLLSLLLSLFQTHQNV